MEVDDRRTFSKVQIAIRSLTPIEWDTLLHFEILPRSSSVNFVTLIYCTWKMNTGFLLDLEVVPQIQIKRELFSQVVNNASGLLCILQRNQPLSEISRDSLEPHQ